MRFLHFSLVAFLILFPINASKSGSTNKEYLTIKDYDIYLQKLGFEPWHVKSFITDDNIHKYTFLYATYKYCNKIDPFKDDNIVSYMNEKSQSMNIDSEIFTRLMDEYTSYGWHHSYPNKEDEALGCNRQLWRFKTYAPIVQGIPAEIMSKVKDLKFFTSSSIYASCMHEDILYDVTSGISNTEVSIKAQNKFVCARGLLDSRDEWNDRVRLRLTDTNVMCEQFTDEKRLEAVKLKKDIYFLRGEFKEISKSSGITLKNCVFLVDENAG